MDIHEYQAKELLSGFGVPSPRGGLAYSPEQAAYRAHEIGGNQWVVKAQIHSGGRGKAGGVKICADEDQVLAAAEELLGGQVLRLVDDAAGTEHHCRGSALTFVRIGQPGLDVGRSVAARDDAGVGDLGSVPLQAMQQLARTAAPIRSARASGDTA